MRGSMIVGVLALLVGSLACLGGIAAMFLSRSRHSTPAAYVGGASLRARVGCPSDRAASAGDASVLAARLEALGLEGTVMATDTTTLEVQLHHVAGPEVLRALLRPGALALAEVLDGAVAVDDAALPPGVTRDAVGRGGDRGFFATSAAELAWLASRAPDDAQLVVGCTTFAGEPPQCEGLFVRRSTAIRNDAIEGATVVMDELSGQPQIAVEMTPAGARDLEMLTRSLVQRRLAIVLDDQLMSAPLVIEEISGGRAMITLGGGSSETLVDVMAEAETLAVALDVGGALGCAWEIQTLETM